MGTGTALPNWRTILTLLVAICILVTGAFLLFLAPAFVSTVMPANSYMIDITGLSGLAVNGTATVMIPVPANAEGELAISEGVLAGDRQPGWQAAIRETPYGKMLAFTTTEEYASDISVPFGEDETKEEPRLLAPVLATPNNASVAEFARAMSGPYRDPPPLLLGRGREFTQVSGGTYTTAVYLDGFVPSPKDTVPISFNLEYLGGGGQKHLIRGSIWVATVNTAVLSTASGFVPVTADYYAIPGGLMPWTRSDPQLPLNDDRPPLFETWYLTSYWTEEGAASVIEGTDVIVAFSGNGWISGSSGCNLFIGEHDLADGKLTIRKIESTTMTSTPEVLNQEKAFLALLLKTEAYDIDGDRLRLLDASGTELLAFTNRPQSLSGRAWHLWYAWNDTEEAVWGDGSDLIALPISLQFPDETRFQGTIAESDYYGTYEADEERIRFWSVEERSEAPGERTDLYERYYSLLDRARRYRITGTELVIENEKGRSSLSFTRMPLSLISADWYPRQYRATDGSVLLSPVETFEMISFTPSGNVFGTIREIQFSAQYDADNASISFGPVALLIPGDSDPGEASESRETIESIFREARTYRVQNGTLELSSGDGEVLMVMTGESPWK